MLIKERIIHLIEYKRIPKEEFYIKIGMTSANFRGNAKKTPINSTAIENILSEIPDVNPKWLLSGKGDMLAKPTDPHKNIPVAFRTEGKGIPLIPIEAMAGFGTGESQILECDCEKYVVPIFKDAEFLIQVRGDSMYPKYSSGDVVACKKLPLEDIFFQWNKVYVLDTVQGALIKRIKKGSDNKHILAVSDNNDYDPFEIRFEQIYSIAIVIGVIRLE